MSLCEIDRCARIGAEHVVIGAIAQVGVRLCPEHRYYLNTEKPHWKFIQLPTEQPRRGGIKECFMPFFGLNNK